jgi:hypothetical protein
LASERREGGLDDSEASSLGLLRTKGLGIRNLDDETRSLVKRLIVTLHKDLGPTASAGQM